MGAWIKANISWLGFVVMCILGGTVGHIKAWQKAAAAGAPPMSWKQHAAGMVVRLIFAAFVTIIVYFLHVGLGWDNLMISFVVAGIAAVFASDVVDLLWYFGQEKARVMFGLPPMERREAVVERREPHQPSMETKHEQN